MKSLFRTGFSILILSTAVFGCGSTRQAVDEELRAPLNLPDYFLVGSFTSSAVTEPGPGDECRNPLVDPRDGTMLRLVRSTGGKGAYEVPDQKYGVRTGELLRIDCATGRGMVVVKR